MQLYKEMAAFIVSQKTGKQFKRILPWTIIVFPMLQSPLAYSNLTCKYFHRFSTLEIILAHTVDNRDKKNCPKYSDSFLSINLNYTTDSDSIFISYNVFIFMLVSTKIRCVVSDMVLFCIFYEFLLLVLVKP